jgi:hypothetical protein
LNPAARREAAKILRAHPDFDRWAKRARGKNADEAIFIEASTWPDDIRGDKRFHSDDRRHDAKAPSPLPGFPDMARHTDWHFRNLPLEKYGKSKNGEPTPLPRRVRPGQLDEQLRRLSEGLAPGKSSLERRAFILPWIIHLTGDAHQPLHAAYRVGRPNPTVKNPFNPRKPVSTLHVFWDHLPAPSQPRGKALKEAVDALTSAYPRAAFKNLAAPSDAWISESWRIAREGAYPPDADGDCIASAFYEASLETARRRVALAGYRLAHLLNALLARRTE